jgi:ketosteroid isomerase-like protein
MNFHLQVIFCGFLAFAGLEQTSAAETETEAKNKAAVQAAFDAWRAGTGGPFGLLTPDATWTITGNSVAAKDLQQSRRVPRYGYHALQRPADETAHSHDPQSP